MDQAEISDKLARQWGAAVRKRREQRGLTQATLGKACDVSQQTIDRIERGETIPRDRLKVVIAARLGVAVADLFAWPSDLTLESAS